MFDKIKSEMVKAMKEQDKFRLSVIRMIKASIDMMRIDKKIEITDEVVIDVLAKELKTREESKLEFSKAGRTDLVENLDKEIAIIKEYLPEPLSEEEVDKIITEALKETEASSIKDMGKVMRLVTPLVKGRCDMKEVSNKIKAKLS
ncbi:MAG TPA: GatB/YqeY domain-containing protein [Candidatus Onthousia faecipullorum]|uniref:GatB/YqeY domain-containing protein n=1 Tax=Candidatus Onthousia faecipullorum TaxID=2840887 RepID=A0A9D1GBP5_9FIRM|nr:GatB/YqeY domain-containing protein [Candidatus Onthousia faecipullorum]